MMEWPIHAPGGTIWVVFAGGRYGNLVTGSVVQKFYVSVNRGELVVRVEEPSVSQLNEEAGTSFTKDQLEASVRSKILRHFVLKERVGA